jgi:peptidase E
MSTPRVLSVYASSIGVLVTILLLAFRASAMSSCSDSSNPENSICENGSSQLSSSGRRLLLTSSGLVTPTMQMTANDLYQKAVEETKSTTCVYIIDALLEPRPTASSTQEESSSSFVQRMTQSMQREWQSITASSDYSPNIVGVELATLPDGGAGNLLDDAACVYLEQGNTYYLLYQIRRTHLDQEIVERFLPRGGLLVGASAGSIVAGHTIRTCEWKNWDDPGHGTWWDCRNLPTGLQGLDLLDGNVGKSLFPHHSPQWNRRVQQMLQRHPEGVVILDEEQFYVQGVGISLNDGIGCVKK